MTLEECAKIIEEERLPHAVYGETRPYCNDLCLTRLNKQWLVYATDERAAKVTGSEAFYDNEEEACTNFLKRLRAGAKLNEQ